MALGSTTTIMNTITQPNQTGSQDTLMDGDFTDDEIENTIAEIQRALQKTQKN